MYADEEKDVDDDAGAADKKSMLAKMLYRISLQRVIFQNPHRNERYSLIKFREFK